MDWMLFIYQYSQAFKCEEQTKLQNMLVANRMLITKLPKIDFVANAQHTHAHIVPSGKRWVIKIEFLLAYADSSVLNIICFHV